MLVRTAHIVAASVWIGGSVFYAFVLIPNMTRLEQAGGFPGAVASSFGKLVTASVWTLLATGGYITFDRLQNQRIGAPYALVLGTKILIAVWMFMLAGALSRNRDRRRRAASRPAGRWSALLPVPKLILLMGLVVFLLSALLTTMYQSG